MLKILWKYKLPTFIACLGGVLLVLNTASLPIGLRWLAPAQYCCFALAIWDLDKFKKENKRDDV